MPNKKVKTVVFEKMSLFIDHKDILVTNARTNETYSPKSKLSWAIRQGYPRLIVYDNRVWSDEKMKNIVIAPFTSTTLYAFFNMIKTVIADRDSRKRHTLVCNNVKWVNGARTDETYVQAKIHVFRNDSGYVCLSVNKEEEESDLVFNIGETLWHKINENAEPSPLTGEFMAKGYLDMLKSLFSTVLVDSVYPVTSISRLHGDIITDYNPDDHRTISTF